MKGIRTDPAHEKTTFKKPSFTRVKHKIHDYFKAFMTQVPIKKRPVHWFAEQINGLFLYDRNLRHDGIIIIIIIIINSVISGFLYWWTNKSYIICTAVQYHC